MSGRLTPTQLPEGSVDRAIENFEVREMDYGDTAHSERISSLRRNILIGAGVGALAVLTGLGIVKGTDAKDPEDSKLMQPNVPYHQDVIGAPPKEIDQNKVVIPQSLVERP